MSLKSSVQNKRTEIYLKHILMLNFLWPPRAKNLNIIATTVFKKFARILLTCKQAYRGSPSLKWKIQCLYTRNTFSHTLQSAPDSKRQFAAAAALVLHGSLTQRSTALLVRRASDLILMSTSYYLCLKVQESFTKSSTDFKRLSCKNKHLFFSCIHSSHSNCLGISSPG